MPCDLYAIDYDYNGTWQPDVTGAFPPPNTAFIWPLAQDWRGPGLYSLAYKVHTPQGGWSTNPQVFTFQVEAPPANPVADWIEQFYRERITSGCNADPLMYCPTNDVNRQQMAVFGLKIKHGSDYVPPDCTGIFQDVPCATRTRTPTGAATATPTPWIICTTVTPTPTRTPTP